MSLRVRHRFTLFPGVRVNVGLGGVSATLGPPGASINVGPRGVRGTIGLPGTGISYSTRLDRGRQREHPRNAAWPAPGAAPENQQWPEEASTPVWTPPPMQAVRSGAIESLTSTGLDEMRRLLVDARRQHAQVAAALAQAQEEENRALAEARRLNRRLLRFLVRKRIANLEDVVLPAARAEIERFEAWRDATKIRVTLDAVPEAMALWGDVVRAFGALMTASAIWDVTAFRQSDRVRERTTAFRTVDRKPVRFTYGQSDLVDYDGSPLQLGNANGENLLLFPGLLLLSRSDGAVALVALSEVITVCVRTNFIEHERVPGDSEVVGHTWLKANKDGSPDRRFADNRQIPVCQYATLGIESLSGVEEQYLISNVPAAEAFANAMIALSLALAGSFGTASGT